MLLENRNSKGVWEGLWTFIGFEEPISRENFQDRLPKGYELLQEGLKLRHTFTHYKLDIDTTLIKINKDFQDLDNNKVWFNTEELAGIGLPSPVSKILKTFI